MVYKKGNIYKIIGKFVNVNVTKYFRLQEDSASKVIIFNNQFMNFQLIKNNGDKYIMIIVEYYTEKNGDINTANNW